ncbi:hypothetical protein V2J09_011769 [Rumex salicifolius]
MEIEDEGNHVTAIAALGPLFKLTEVYLWDEGSAEIQRDFSLRKHIIFKYDDDENENDCGDSKDNLNLEVHSTADREVLVDGSDVVGVLTGEDMNLAQQMSTLGLPLSFQTNKDKSSGPKRGKRNDILRSCNQKKKQDEVLQSTKLSEKENSFNDGVNNAETINLDGMIIGDDVCDESSANLPSNDGTTSPDFGSCMISDQPQASGIAESSDTFVHDQDDSCYYTGSFGDWTAIWDSYYMRNYFYNVKTNESTWYPPPGMGHLALNNTTNELSADLVKRDADLAISRNDSELTCKSSEGDRGTNGRLLDKLVSSFTANTDETQVLEGDCSTLSEPCSSMEIPEQILDLDVIMEQNPITGICDSKITGGLTETINEVEYDELLISQGNEGEMEASAGEVDNEVIPAAPKRKKKAKKSRSKKKSVSNNQEQHFQCTIEAFYGGIGKYWCQRYRLFSKFDQGIKMDEEGWFSVTPEALARHQASRCGKGVIIDCFTGSGGNAIQFARTGRHVIAVDIDPKKIEYAKHNAAIYGVEDQIDFVIGDSFTLVSKMDADTVFLSPPWGGPEYSKVRKYDIAMLKPRDGQFLFDTFKETASMIVMFMPRNVDLNQLAELCLSAGPLWSVEVEKNFLNDRLKAVTAYFCKASV